MDRIGLTNEHAEWLEEVRKIPCEIAAQAGLGSSGNNLVFEFLSASGELKFRKFRSPEKKFWIEPKGSDLCLWNEPCLAEPCAPETPLILTEGELDAVSWMSVGATHVVSVPNGAALQKPGVGNINPLEDKAFAYLWEGEKLKPGLARFKKIVLSTDADEKGNILRGELAVRLGRVKCWYVEYPKGCKDANEVLVKHGFDGLAAMLTNAKPLVPNRLVPFSDIPRSNMRRGVSPGFGAAFDKHFVFMPPQLIVVTGKPNAGKSQFTLAMMANIARHHEMKGAILQFEDNPDRNRDDLIRHAESWCGDPEAWVDRMFRTISPSEAEDGEDFDLFWLRAAIEEAATRHGCKWILIDPWNEIEHLWGKQDTEATYLNRAVKQLKLLCRKYQIAIIVVTHPSKDGARATGVEEATLNDINGGAVWNNKADLGLIVWADDTTRQERRIKVAKSKDFQRYGIPGIVEMKFDWRKMNFMCLQDEKRIKTARSRQDLE